jgi:hypothetical protein
MLTPSQHDGSDPCDVLLLAAADDEHDADDHQGPVSQTSTCRSYASYYREQSWCLVSYRIRHYRLRLTPSGPVTTPISAPRAIAARRRRSPSIHTCQQGIATLRLVREVRSSLALSLPRTLRGSSSIRPKLQSLRRTLSSVSTPPSTGQRSRARVRKSRRYRLTRRSPVNQPRALRSMPMRPRLRHRRISRALSKAMVASPSRQPTHRAIRASARLLGRFFPTLAVH